MLQQTWFAIGHALDSSFSLLRGMGWLPDVVFIVVLAFGAAYWLMWQARYNRRAKEKGESI